jgi:DNA-binding NtrC family response regulator
MKLSFTTPRRFYRRTGGTIMPRLQQQPTVFVVDDEDVIATSLAMILRLQGGLRARAFSKPFEALAAARLEAPDLLISDVVMPDLSGIDLAILVQEYCPDCKVLLFSGQAATVHLLEAAAKSGHDFEVLSKPVHPSDLLIRIQNLTDPLSSLQSDEELLR